ncbi:DUF3298 domain-containing protein [Pasteurellaceae bacterium HPA106]|uniref:RsiV family protein n=1 Tax=Spirabiliibacterium pneumoniae TaxID=221400 RepID=UPI001AACEB40|nr:RsiV family protein [Spirabiliibacterium pneumoniae]MBE2896339.1 DUF3298 domain-containing protein [Spirabiliibacterium pneumoniae]
MKLTALTALLLSATAVQAQTPLLDVKPVQLTAEKACMEKPDLHCYALQVVTLKTGQAWLDSYFEENARNYLEPVLPFDLDEKVIKQKQVEFAKLDLATLAKVQLESVKKVLSGEDALIGWESYYAPHFLGQRGNIAMFSEDFYVFQGGAHGFGSTTFTNFDLNSQTRLSIDNIVEPGQRSVLLNLLKAAYVDYIKAENQGVDGATDVDTIARERLNDYKDTFAADDFNFTFTYRGIEFKFPPYALGSYVEGEINLILPYQTLFGVVKSEFLADSIKSINFSENF